MAKAFYRFIPHILCISMLLLLSSCKEKKLPCQDPRNPDCENYNPCIDEKAVNADFTILEYCYFDETNPINAGWNQDSDSIYQGDIWLEANYPNADSYTWHVERYPEPLNGKKIRVGYNEGWRGKNITIKLIVKAKPNKTCFPMDDGIDTVTRSFYYLQHNEQLKWEGTYFGSDDDKPDSNYTIVLDYSFNSSTQKNTIKVFGLPRGCRDTAYEVRSYPSKNFSYKNLSIDIMQNYPSGIGINCGRKIVDGIYQNGNSYTIRQQYRWRVNGILQIKERIFKGIKIK